MFYSPVIQPRCCDGRLKFKDFLDDPGIRTHWWITSCVLKIFGKSVDAEINGRVYHLNKNSFLKWQTKQAAFVPKERDIAPGLLINQVCVNLLNKKIIEGVNSKPIEELFILCIKFFSYSKNQKKIEFYQFLKKTFDHLIDKSNLFDKIRVCKQRYQKSLYPSVHTVIENMECILDDEKFFSFEALGWMKRNGFVFNKLDVLEKATQTCTDPMEVAFIEKLKHEFDKRKLINQFGEKFQILIDEAVIKDENCI